MPPYSLWSWKQEHLTGGKCDCKKSSSCSMIWKSLALPLRFGKSHGMDSLGSWGVASLCFLLRTKSYKAIRIIIIVMFKNWLHCLPALTITGLLQNLEFFCRRTVHTVWRQISKTWPGNVLLFYEHYITLSGRFQSDVQSSANQGNITNNLYVYT